MYCKKHSSIKKELLNVKRNLLLSGFRCFGLRKVGNGYISWEYGIWYKLYFPQLVEPFGSQILLLLLLKRNDNQQIMSIVTIITMIKISRLLCKYLPIEFHNLTNFPSKSIRNLPLVWLWWGSWSWCCCMTISVFTSVLCILLSFALGCA